MRALFPYRYPIITVKVNDSWMIHAKNHAEILRANKGNVKTSNWDISTRIGEIALRYFLLHLGVIDKIGDLSPGIRCPPVATKDDFIIGIQCPPANEQYNMGTNAGLRVHKFFITNLSLCISALYDPPYVDMIGWTDANNIKTQSVDSRGRVQISITELRTMKELVKILTKDKLNAQN